MEIEKILGVIASTLNIDATEWTAELKDGDKWADDAAEKVAAKISAQVKAVKEAQHKRGIREKGKAIETFFKQHGFENPEKLEGDAYLSAVLDHIGTKQGDSAGSDDTKALTKEQLAKLPEVKALIQEAKQDAGKQLADLQASFSAKEREFMQTRVKDRTSALMPQILDDANIVLEVPGMENSRQSRIQALQALINWNEIGLDEKGNPIFVDSEGSPATDDFGKVKEFKKWLVDTGANIYGTHKGQPGQSGANPQGGPNGQQGATRYSFADESSFSRAYQTETDAAKRVEMLKAYKEQKAAGT